MKFKGNNRRSHLMMYCVLFASILVLVGPLYAISYNTVKEQILSDSRSTVNRGISCLDMEMEVFQTIRMQMQNDTRFIRMKNLSAFEEVRQYIIFKDFADYFKAQTNMFILASDEYIFFRENNCVVSNKHQYDNMEPIFQKHINMEGMDWTEFRSAIFEKKTEFSARYVEDIYVDGEKQPSLVVTSAINPYINQPPEAIIVWIYSIDKMFAEMNLADYREIFDFVEINGEMIYPSGAAYQSDRESQILEGCKNINLKIAMDISDQYSNQYMDSFRKFLLVYMIALIGILICLERFLSYWRTRPIKNMVDLVANLTGDTPAAGKGIEYISDVVEKINLENQQYHENLLNFLFLKRLDSDEREFICKKYPDFAKPFLFVVFFGEMLSAHLLKLCMDKFELRIQRLLSPQEGECIIFLEYSQELEIDILRETLEQIVDELKNYSIDTAGLISIPCGDVSEFYDAYRYIKNCYRYVDYNGIFSFEHGENADAQVLESEQKQLYNSFYNNLMQGNAFEANKAVYSLWYQTMTRGDISTDAIQKMFYRQLGILADVAEKVRYCGELAQYDSKKKINELAFDIAEDVEAVCNLIVGRENQEDERIQAILNWIDENFNTPDFCMTAMENQFGMSGRTLGKIIKSNTGKTFQEYVDERKLELAKRLISQPDVNMKTVAQECGFINYDTFYKFFKKHTGTSPKQWRNIDKDWQF